MPDKPIPNFARMTVGEAKALALFENNWQLYEHKGNGDVGDLNDDSAIINRNCSHHPAAEPVRATGASLGVILDTDPPPVGPLRSSAATAGTSRPDANPYIPDFSGMTVSDAQNLAFAVGRWVIKEHKGDSHDHRWPSDYSAEIAENCNRDKAGSQKATGGDLGVILDTRILRRWLRRHFFTVVGGLIGGATSLVLARAFGFIWSS